eukprot:gene55478-9553_t
MTNGHALWVWMDMFVPNTSTVECGRCGAAPLERHRRMHGGGSPASMFWWQLARLKYGHLKDLRPTFRDHDAARTSRAAVVSLRCAVGGHALDPATLRQWIRTGFSGLKLPIIWAPNPSPYVRLGCAKKNPERLRLATSAFDAALSEVLRQPPPLRGVGVLQEKGHRLPPVAFLPSFEMGKAVWWDVPTQDVSGTHSYCSMVGLMMWQMSLDLVCPA